MRKLNILKRINHRPGVCEHTPGKIQHVKYLYLCFLFLYLLQGITVHAQQRPHILWITIEDTSPEFIGCYGNRAAHTPNIDRLAKEGVRFSNVFSTGTVCSPSRTAIITGVKTYCTGTGHHRSAFPVPVFMKGFPYYLQQAGYYTSNSAKTDYNVSNETAYTQEAWNESSVKAGWWNRKPGQPFFAVFNFNASHQSNTMTNPYAQYKKAIWANLSADERIADDAFEMPPFYHNSPEMRKEMARVYNSLSLTDKRIGELLDRLKKDHLMDSTIIIFYGDHGEGIPRGKTNGISFGFRVPFVIWFPEMYKHLSPWGTDVVTDELIDFTDLAPTMISLAGGVKPAYMSGRAFMGTARRKAPEYLVLSSDRSDNGPDLVRAVTDGRYFYARNFMPWMPQLRYIRYMEIGTIKQLMRSDWEKGALDPLQQSLFEPRPAEFLFDTKTDPWETRDLSGAENEQRVLRKMRGRLEKEMLSEKDIMLLPEGELDTLSTHITPYAYRLNEKAYPFHQIYAAASLSGFRTPETLKKQLALLKDPDKIVRYWAVTGLRAQKGAALKPYRSRLLPLLKDAYPPVAITAAAICYELDQDPRAKDCLTYHILGKNQYWALMSVNFLLYSHYKKPFIEPVQQCRGLEGRSYAAKAACMDFLGSLGLVLNDMDHRQ
ncbi:sulfatase-like hydrolase/transferase [Niabella drilacis]|uniref:Arylsulfatase A n=1 Tax=Niabella drilacis (strain DSM 25811 / CCM 8410 / CCUG 62505 / LMG 26954 / E90) TaxID=1285928 RepID=A0A1G6RJ11_NIADE|nr:sulfatase-like hydrolase/transferase [Niabella drilacis]SDD03957.1 Arylsulfatase A [Niabella drilacis]